MTEQKPAGATTTPWYVRPRTVLPLLAGLLVISVLFTPEPSSGNDDPRLSSYSAQPSGARLLYELAGRLGWTVSRSASTKLPLDSSRIIAVMAPVVELREREVHDMLEHVRGGGAMLAVVQQGAALLADSLGLERTLGGDPIAGSRSARPCPPGRGNVFAVLDRSGARARELPAVSLKPGSPLVGDTLLAVRTNINDVEETQPVMFAATLGTGRIVVVSAVGALNNQALRYCPTGYDIIAVQALEFLSGPNRERRLVFDEYHQGYGAHAGSLPAILAEFAGTRAGRMLFQLAGAGVLLLLAFAPRAVPPREAPLPERRSPLEHVDALARAYQQVGATRTATSRLVRGLRRRVDRGAIGTRAGHSDAQFLDHVVQYHPVLQDDVALIRAASSRDVDKAQWSDVPIAIDRIERTLTRK